MKSRMKVVLITGGSTGIGRALTTVFSGRGYRVWATVRRLETIADPESATVAEADRDVNSPAAIRLGTRSLWLPKRSPLEGYPPIHEPTWRSC